MTAAKSPAVLPEGTEETGLGIRAGGLGRDK